MKNHDKLDSHGSKTSFSTRLRWFLLGMAGTAVCWFFWWPIYFTFSGGRYIGSKPPGESYTATQFEFRYGNATRVVKDPYNKMQWVFGQLPDSIEVDKTGMRLIVYNSHNAIVKSWEDSMEAYPNSFYHKGYMGIWDDGITFTIDSKGIVR